MNRQITIAALLVALGGAFSTSNTTSADERPHIVMAFEDAV